VLQKFFVLLFVNFAEDYLSFPVLSTVRFINFIQWCLKRFSCGSHKPELDVADVKMLNAGAKNNQNLLQEV
jgi:hypothetical protein